MSKHTLKYEYITPCNIESEVPRKQEIRDPKNGNITETTKDNTEHEKENFVPVLTIKKEETALTKGDYKLQKVFVTENVAEEDNSNTVMVVNPLYSEILSTVMSPQPLRESPKDIGGDNEEKVEVSDKDREERKLRTRIPKLKFKQTVERIQKERKHSEGQEKVKHPTQGRRSSIPKLRRRRNSKSINDDINKETNLVANNEDTTVDKPDEEFEKLYDEVVDDKFVEAVADKILPVNIENPDELETSFKEIIHAYDDNKIQSIPTGQNKSKIPLSKQRSLHEESLPKQMERRLSLKSTSLNDKEKQNGSHLPNVKTNKDVSKIPMVIKDGHKTIASEEKINSTKSNKIDKVDEDMGESYIKTKKQEESFSPTRNHRFTEQNLPQNTDKDIKLNYKVKESVKEKQQNKENPSENTRIVKPNDSDKASLEHSDSKIPDSSKMVMDMFPSHDKIKDDDSSKHRNEVNKTILKEENDSNPNDSNDFTSVKENLNEPNPKKSILSKIAIFQGKDAIAPKLNDQVTRKEKLVLKRLDNKKEKNINYEKHSDIEPNKTPELKSNETIESSHNDGTIPNVQNEQVIEDFRETKNKKIYIATNITEKDNIKASNCKEDNNKEETDVGQYEELADANGEIGDIISKKDSSDKAKLGPIKKLEMDTPKNRNVFSKIAMFERQSSKEPKKVKKETSENKVQIYTLEEININNVEYRKPKIVDTVLKTQPLRKSLIEDDFSDTPITSADIYITDPYKTNDEMSTNKIQEIKTIEINKLETVETEQQFIDKSSKGEKVYSTSVCEKSTEEGNIVSTTENVDNKSNPNIIRSKSALELEQGGTVKEKLHQLVVGMNSTEKIEVERKEVIPVRERPRKRSVSEKIALFERKLAPVKVESTETTTVQNIQKNEKETNIYLPKALTEEEYEKRIEELGKASEIYGKIEKMPRVQLRDGSKMPVLSVGTALLDPRLIQPIIKAAIDLGYRAIDAAFIYGNEKEIGEAIKAKIDDGTVTREDLFIVNKLWNTFHRQDLVEKACKDSLATMGLEYFDLYLIHSPISFKEGKNVVPMIANVLQYSNYNYMDAWFGMEDLVKKGLVKSIGVSNFNSQQLARVEEKARIKPVINQVECHPYLSQQMLADACADSGVKLSCFGILGSKGTPNELKTNVKPVIDDPLIVVMAAGLNVSAAQLLVRYQIERGHLAVVKASSGAHLWNNLEALNFQLTPAQLTALNALNQNKRTYTFKGMGDTHRNYPFRTPY